jgi:2-polyprenyl-3-methyl-5-hydroxy-6-metoxy-1,4-benzoquinol methylase
MTEPQRTEEKQYERLLQVRDTHGLQPLGLMLNQAWYDDPKRLAFTFARYKFVAKMLDGCKNVLEVGCGDAFASRMVQQHVGALSVTDFDQIFLDDVRARQVKGWEFKQIFRHDLIQGGAIPGSYDAVYTLDVLEHIAPEHEGTFLRNMLAPLDPDGTAVIGIPSLESQAHASALSKVGHVNCQTQAHLKDTLMGHFRNVFMFSMNDEVVHTGYSGMAQYLLALCCNKR